MSINEPFKLLCLYYFPIKDDAPIYNKYYRFGSRTGLMSSTAKMIIVNIVMKKNKLLTHVMGELSMKRILVFPIAHCNILSTSIISNFQR